MVNSSVELDPSGPAFSDALPIEFYGRAGSVNLEGASRTHSVGANEDPVLPGSKAAKDAGFEGFARSKAQIGFEAGECIGRLRDARFNRLADFVFPVEVVGCSSDERSFEKIFWGKTCTASLVF